MNVILQEHDLVCVVLLWEGKSFESKHLKCRDLDEFAHVTWMTTIGDLAFSKGMTSKSMMKALKVKIDHVSLGYVLDNESLLKSIESRQRKCKVMVLS